MNDETTDGASPDGDGQQPRNPWEALSATSNDGASGPAGSSAPGEQRPGAEPIGGYGVSLPSDGAYPAYPGRPGEPQGRGRAFIGIAVGAVLALAAGAFAVTSFGDAGPSSPEAAVEAMFAAVEQQDVLGVLDTLAPEERELYQPFLEDVVGELSRLQVLSDDVDLGSVSGFEVDVEGLELESDQLGEGVSVVRITGGTITGSVDPREVPVGTFVQDLMEDPENDVDMDVVSESGELAADEPVEIVVIEDQGWHVSLHYTIAEAARRAAGAPVPDFGAGVEPEGAPSPEAAVRALVQASVDLDARRVIALLAPGEMSALHDYAPLFLDDAEEAVAELRAESDFEISIDQLDTEVDEQGDVAEVSVSAFAASGQVDGEPFAVAYDGECFTGTFEGDSEEMCIDDEEPGMGGALAERMVAASLTVGTVQEDGRWYVTPIRTSMSYGLTVLRALDPEDLEDPEAFFSEAFGFGPSMFGPGGFEEDMAEGDLDFGGTEGEGLFEEPADVEREGSAGVDPYEECAAVYDELPVDPTAEQYDEADEQFDACYDELLGVQGDEPSEACPPVDEALEPGATSGGTPEADSDCSVAVLGDEVDTGCSDVYSTLPAEPTDEDFAEADAAYEACQEAAVSD